MGWSGWSSWTCIAVTTVFFTTMGSQVTEHLTADGMSQVQAEQDADAIANSAGAAIGGLAGQPQTQPIAEVGKVALTDGIEIGGYLAAGFVLLGLVATAIDQHGVSWCPAPFRTRSTEEVFESLTSDRDGAIVALLVSSGTHQDHNDGQPTSLVLLPSLPSWPWNC